MDLVSSYTHSCYLYYIRCSSVHHDGSASWPSRPLECECIYTGSRYAIVLSSHPLREVVYQFDMADQQCKKCYVCGLSFNSNSARYRHAKRVHPDSERIRRGEVASESVHGIRVDSVVCENDDVGPRPMETESVKVRYYNTVRRFVTNVVPAYIYTCM